MNDGGPQEKLECDEGSRACARLSSYRHSNIYRESIRDDSDGYVAALLDFPQYFCVPFFSFHSAFGLEIALLVDSKVETE